MRVFFSNLGCKLNQAEIEFQARKFVSAGHQLVASLDQADLHVVNSCTVTHLAARDSRKVVRRSQRQGTRVVLTGCYASDPAAKADELGVDLVVPNQAKDELLERVHAQFPEEVPAAVDLPVPFVPIDVGHQRALIKVEDGCNMHCAFCIIPTTRGRQRSRPVAEVVAEAQSLAAAGFPEIIITGVQISEYRDGEARLADLLRALLDDTTAHRFRVTSIAPWRFDDRLIGLLAEPRICRHVHLSLQSGANATLRRMARPYAAEGYAALVDRLRRAVPGIAITTDVIVGFPGETPAEFAESCAFVEEIGFAKLHAFSFSPRQGTRAATMPGAVDPREIRERMQVLLEIGQRSEAQFWASQLGQTAEVVWDENRGRRSSGLTDNYIRVWTDEPMRPGACQLVELLEVEERGVRIQVKAS